MDDFRGDEFRGGEFRGGDSGGGGSGGDQPEWWERILGSGAHFRLGWWTLPLFVGVGLTGAVLAGTLAVVYYSQQVSSLRAETREGRERIERAVEEVEQVRQQALQEIDRRVQEIRESLSQGLAAGDATTHGVVAVRATIGAGSVRGAQTGAATQAPTPGEAGATPSGEAATGEPDREPDRETDQEPDQETDPGTDQETDQEPDEQSTGPQAPPTEPERPTERVGSGFAVQVDEDAVWYVTSYSLLADPTVAGGITDRVEVVTRSGTTSAQVHSWDEQRDVALLRTAGGDSAVPTWRSSAQQASAGEEVVAVGVTPGLNTVQQGGTVSYATGDVTVVELARVSFLVGGPVVDGQGRVIGVFTPGYRSFGAGDTGQRQGIVPLHLLCERIMKNCQQLQQPGG